MCDDGDGDGDGISLSKFNPVQSGLSVWLNSSMARLNQYFFFSYLRSSVSLSSWHQSSTF